MSRRWWDQKGIDCETAKARVAVTESESESESDTGVKVQTEPKEKEEESRTYSGVSGSSKKEWSSTSVDPWE